MKMKTLMDYIVQSKYEFRIKTCFPITDEIMDAIEGVLARYRPESISRPKKMMFQTNPIGFTGAKNVEVYFVDCVVTIPAESFIIQCAILESLGLANTAGSVHVCAPTDEVEVIEEPKSYDDPKLLDGEYKDATPINVDDYCGDGYTKKLLNYMKDKAIERDEKALKNSFATWAKPAVETEQQNPMDFNKSIDDPKSGNMPTRKGK